MKIFLSKKNFELDPLLTLPHPSPKTHPECVSALD